MSGSALLRHVVTFGRVLREAGLEVGPARLMDALTGLDAVDVTSRDDVYWTLRTTLVTRREELDPFDRAFSAWFLRAPVRPPVRVAPALRRQAERGRAPEDDAAPRARTTEAATTLFPGGAPRSSSAGRISPR